MQVCMLSGCLVEQDLAVSSAFNLHGVPWIVYMISRMVHELYAAVACLTERKDEAVLSAEAGIVCTAQPATLSQWH